MTKKTVAIPYEDEKLSALRLYLGQANTTLEKEMGMALDALYEKTVPPVVREFLDLRTGKGNEKEKTGDVT